MQLTLPSEARRIVVIGGGLTGLTTAYRLEEALRREAVAASITVLEREDRLGGKFFTIRRDGFIIEAGPEGFVGAAPEGYQLCAELGLAGDLQSPGRAHGGSSIFYKGKLHPITQGVTDILPLRPGLLLAEGVLSPLGALRAMLEPFIPPRTDGPEESMAAFLRRRFGDEAWWNVLEPLMGGIAGGEGESLSAPAAAPALVAFERKYGSVSIGARKQKALLDDLGKADVTLVAPRQGMDAIIDRLVARLRERPAVTLRTGMAVEAVERRPAGYEVIARGAEGVERLPADVVVITAPAFQAADSVRPLDRELAETLASVSFRSMATFSYAFRAEEAPKILAGTGYVKHSRERGPVNSMTWDSIRWEGHAPEGYALLRAFISDDRVVEQCSDDELIALGLDEIRTVLKIQAEPLFVAGRRWSPALPRYTLGHLERVAKAAQRAAALPGIVLAGTSYKGRGVVDAIRSGSDAAAAAARLAAVPGPGVVV
ncbi:MAG: protoporphyrinogen oxidase [Chloroflexota bacterium]|nr:protoporphyrinogen oxidase [Dehalococcoidia bacterium]MDW8253157.1 protoporphyrinogen oxidase [Chloroflexota bacterium]